jgi:chromosome partitioning protein
MHTIAVVNQKGGCGKTTTAINLAAELASRGHRTLLADMDPQSHCASGLGVPHERIERDLAQALLGDLDRGPDPTNVLWEVSRNLYLAPSTVRLAALEAPNGPMAHLSDRDRRLSKLLARFAPNFEYCLVDCPPTIGLLTFNALRAADEALVPVETGFFSLQGAEKQWQAIRKVSERLGRVIPVRFLPTLHNPARKVARDVMHELQSRFSDALVPCVIHEHDDLREAVGFGRPVREHAPDSGATTDFASLTDWLVRAAATPRTPLVEVDRRTVAAMLDPQKRSQADGRVEEGLDDRAGGSDAPGDARSHDPTRSGEDRRGGGRVAELVERMRRTGGRHPDEVLSVTDLADAPPIAEDAAESRAERPPSLRLVGGEEAAGATPAAVAETGPPPMGVSFVEEGVRFVQPAAGASSMVLEADFGPLFGQGVGTIPMRADEERGIYEVTVAVPPGQYEYRLRIDGRATVDPFNLERRVRPDGEVNLLRVPGR